MPVPKSRQTQIQAALLITAASTTAVVGWACRPVVTTPDIVIYAGNNNGPSTTPGASPSPGPTGSLPEGARIRVGVYGQSCPPGVTPPNNSQGQIKVGCTAFITASPKFADGTDIPSTVHGSVITWAYLSGNGSTADCRGDPANDFNRICVGRSPGPLVLQATVKNVTGVAELQVIGLAGGP